MCNCKCGECKRLEEMKPVSAEPQEGDDGFMGFIAALVLLGTMSSFSNSRIENVDDLRKRADSLHQHMLNVADEVQRRMDEVAEEGTPDEV